MPEKRLTTWKPPVSGSGVRLSGTMASLWVWSEGKDLLFDCFLIAVAEALPLI